MQKSVLKLFLFIFFVPLIFSGIFLSLLKNISFAAEDKQKNEGDISLKDDNISLSIAEVTDRSITISWQTPDKTSSIIYYGDNIDALNAITDKAFLLDHKFTIFNLTPKTKYFLKVESSDFSGNKFYSNLIEASTLEDKTPPINPAQFSIAKDQEGKIKLFWLNPNDADYKETFVFLNDQEIYRGVQSEFFIQDIKSDSEIKIYAADQSGNLSGGVSFFVSPDGEIKTKEKPQGFLDLNPALVYVFVRFDNGGKFLLSPINGIAQNQNSIKIYEGAKITFSIDPMIFKKEIKKAYARLNSIDYLFQQNGKYLQTTITFPLTTNQDIPVWIIIEFNDNTAQNAIFHFSTQPFPEVFSQDEDGSQLKIPFAEISLYWQNPLDNNFEFWASSLFAQKNPVISDQNGKFNFYVPEGIYKLKIKKAGYKDFESEPFFASFIIDKSIKIFKDVLINNSSDNKKEEIKVADIKTQNGNSPAKKLSLNKTIDMLPFLIFMMLGFFIVMGSIIALILLKLHLSHYHLIKKHTDQIHKDLVTFPSKKNKDLKAGP